MVFDWDIAIKLALGGVAIWTLYYKRTEIQSLSHKDFTAKLDSTIRFKKDFYEKNNVSKLVKDRAAQELARLDYVDYDFIYYLIKLHEARVVNMDELLRLYKSGRKFIIYTPQEKVSVNNFKLKIKEGRSVKRQAFIYSSQYLFFAMLFVLPFAFSEVLLKYIPKNIPWFAYFFAGVFLTSCFIMAISSLLDTANIHDAETFIDKLKKADDEYQEILRQKELEELNKPKVSNYSEYHRNH